MSVTPTVIRSETGKAEVMHPMPSLSVSSVVAIYHDVEELRERTQRPSFIERVRAWFA